MARPLPSLRSADRIQLIGVVHLHPLPGSPRSTQPLREVLALALADVDALVQGGVDGVMVENFGDTPFCPGPVPPITVAAMTRVACAVRERVPGLLGINVLRNDARAALAVAHTAEADLVRVNVHTGAMVTDQGVIQGAARETLLDRRMLGGDIAIMADVMVKHAVPLGPLSLEDAARDTWFRGGADALIVTGSGTGVPTSAHDLLRVRRAAPAPLWLGSGLTPALVPELGPCIDGAIVGTAFHADSDLARPLDVDRIIAMREALDAVRR